LADQGSVHTGKFQGVGGLEPLAVFSLRWPVAGPPLAAALDLTVLLAFMALFFIRQAVCRREFGVLPHRYKLKYLI
jgi:hypothetical protein